MEKTKSPPRVYLLFYLKLAISRVVTRVDENINIMKASEVNETAGVSKARKIPAEDFRFTLVLEFKNQNFLVES